MSKGIHPKSEFKKGHKINIGRKEEKSGNWKGDYAKTVAMHHWVIRWKGQPDTCENCGKSGLSGHQINWANIDHQYKRILEDYIRLCIPCHRKFDNNKIKI